MPVRDTAIDSVPFSRVTIDDAFWSPWTETNREVTIAHQYDQLEAGGSLDNFRRVADGESGGFRGMWFQDSDAYKWIEAASYVLTIESDPDLEARIDDVIELIAAAQGEDGYLNTYFALCEPENRWTNLHMMHELYCAGHLIEAAVAHYRATGQASLLDVATDFADHIDRMFGTEIDGVPGHEEIELALLRLYRVTDESRYLDLACYFIDLRGKEDRLAWELAHPEEIGGGAYEDRSLLPDPDNPKSLFLDGDGNYSGTYAQAHEPLRKQSAVEGHSVRAMYCFAGAADLAGETDDEALFEALEGLWENMTTKRMYLTGGIGPEERHEGFTVDYDLRNDAYAETCAAVGSVFWNQRMFECTGEAKYADLIERILYNGFLAGVAMDGTEFFYENPLASDGDHHRKGWFACACCPPNAARLLASLGNYIYADSEEGIYVNQYISSETTIPTKGEDLTITQKSSLPWDEDVELRVEASAPIERTLRLRVPSWTTNPIIEIDGEEWKAEPGEYVDLTQEWENSEVVLSFPQSVEAMVAHPSVEADAGRIALVRGPLVYCLEATDNDRPLHQYAIDTVGEYEYEHREDLLGGVTVIEGEARVPMSSGWDEQLYAPVGTTGFEDASFEAIPYFAWDNREPGAMAVWNRSASNSKQKEV